MPNFAVQPSSPTYEISHHKRSSSTSDLDQLSDTCRSSAIERNKVFRDAISQVQTDARTDWISEVTDNLQSDDAFLEKSHVAVLSKGEASSLCRADSDTRVLGSVDTRADPTSRKNASQPKRSSSLGTLKRKARPEEPDSDSAQMQPAKRIPSIAENMSAMHSNSSSAGISGEVKRAASGEASEIQVPDLSAVPAANEENDHSSGSQTASSPHSVLSTASLESGHCEGDDDGDEEDVLLNEHRWLPVAGPMSWVQRQMAQNVDPRTILNRLLPAGASIPEGVHDVMLWKVIVSILSEPPKRKKLDHINTFEDALSLIRSSSRIIVLTGAGVSVSCGIPDFRSRNGLYARLAEEYPDLPDPQSMFDIDFFKGNPYPFFKFAKEIFPGKFEPSLCHHFIRMLEVQGKLLRNYTQNIDTLEQVAGIERVVQCHGSFAKAACMKCKYSVNCADIKEDILNQVIPRCPRCPADSSASILKPDIVFFGENLPKEFHEQMTADKQNCDLLIVIGSSLKVQPVMLIPNSLPSNIPQILINREPLGHLSFDVELLGDCDVIVTEITRLLGWSRTTLTAPPLKQIGLEELIPEEPLKLTSILGRFYQLRAPESDQSYTSEMETSQISNELGLSCSEYGSPLDSSQLSVIKLLNVNGANSHDAMSVDTSHGSPIRPATSRATKDDKMSGEPSFSGKLGAGSDTDAASDIPPITVSTPVKPAIPAPKSISTRLPDNSYLFMEPNRYVFRGAEVYPGSDTVSDEGDDSDSFYSPSSSEDLGEDPLENSQADTNSEVNDTGSVSSVNSAAPVAVAVNHSDGPFDIFSNIAFIQSTDGHDDFGTLATSPQTADVNGAPSEDAHTADTPLGTEASDCAADTEVSDSGEAEVSGSEDEEDNMGQLEDSTTLTGRGSMSGPVKFHLGSDHEFLDADENAFDSFPNSRTIQPHL